LIGKTYNNNDSFMNQTLIPLPRTYKIKTRKCELKTDIICTASECDRTPNLYSTSAKVHWDSPTECMFFEDCGYFLSTFTCTDLYMRV